MFQAPQVNYAPPPSMDPAGVFLESMRATQKARLEREQQEEQVRRNQALEAQAKEQHKLQLAQEARAVERQKQEMRIAQAEEERKRLDFEATAVKRAQETAGTDEPAARNMLQMVFGPGAMLQRKTPLMPAELADRPLGLGDATPQAPSVDEESAASKARRYRFDPALGPVPDDQRMPPPAAIEPLSPDDTAAEERRQGQLKQREAFEKAKGEYEKAQKADQQNPAFTMQLPGRMPGEFRPFAAREAQDARTIALNERDAAELRQRGDELAELEARVMSGEKGIRLPPFRAAEIYEAAEAVARGETKSKGYDFALQLMQDRSKGERGKDAARLAEARWRSGERTREGQGNLATMKVYYDERDKLLKSTNFPARVQAITDLGNAMTSAKSKNSVLNEAAFVRMADTITGPGERMSNQDAMLIRQHLGGLADNVQAAAAKLRDGGTSPKIKLKIYNALVKSVKDLRASVKHDLAAFDAKFIGNPNYANLGEEINRDRATYYGVLPGNDVAPSGMANTSAPMPGTRRKGGGRSSNVSASVTAPDAADAVGKVEQLIQEIEGRRKAPAQGQQQGQQ